MSSFRRTPGGRRVPRALMVVALAGLVIGSTGAVAGSSALAKVTGTRIAFSGAVKGKADVSSQTCEFHLGLNQLDVDLLLTVGDDDYLFSMIWGPDYATGKHDFGDGVNIQLSDLFGSQTWGESEYHDGGATGERHGTATLKANSTFEKFSGTFKGKLYPLGGDAKDVNIKGAFKCAKVEQV